MDGSYNMKLMHSTLKTMTASEQDELEEQMDIVRGRRFYHFTDLPAELRNRIYRLAIQPSDIKFHVIHGIAPALLKVNRQINTEFQGLYYSHEYMNVEYYDRETKSRIQEENTKMFPFILAHRQLCSTGRVSTSGNTWQLSIAISQSFNPPPPSNSRAGIFTWKGSPEGAEVPCGYSTDAIKKDEEVRRYPGSLQ